MPRDRDRAPERVARPLGVVHDGAGGADDDRAEDLGLAIEPEARPHLRLHEPVGVLDAAREATVRRAVDGVARVIPERQALRRNSAPGRPSRKWTP